MIDGLLIEAEVRPPAPLPDRSNIYAPSSDRIEAFKVAIRGHQIGDGGPRAPARTPVTHVPHESVELEIILVVPEEPEERKNPLTDHATWVQANNIDQLIYSLRVGKKKYQDIYVHAKVMIVDDKWITVGSANANPRSFLLDDKINVAVRDDAVAHELRIGLWAEHVQATDMKPFELAQTKSLVGRWNTAAGLRTAGTTSAARIERHVLEKGTKLMPPKELAFIMLTLNLDLFVMEEAPDDGTRAA